MNKKEIMKLTKNIKNDENMWNFLAIVYAYGYDLCSKSNYYGSANYDWEFLDNETIKFLYMGQPIVKRMKIKNMSKNLFLREEKFMNIFPKYIKDLTVKGDIYKINWEFVDRCINNLKLNK